MHENELGDRAGSLARSMLGGQVCNADPAGITLLVAAADPEEALAVTLLRLPILVELTFKQYPLRYRQHSWSLGPLRQGAQDALKLPGPGPMGQVAKAR